MLSIILNREEAMYLLELTEAFLAAKQHAFAPNTRRAYRSDLMTCARVLGMLPIREITVAHLRLFLDATADLAPTTLARRKAALCSCFGWACQQELLPADPTARLEAIPIGERHPRPLTQPQVEAILAAIPRQELRNRLLVTLLYETGMRVGEALGLQVQQVHLNDLDGGYLRLVGKGTKERVIALIDASRSVTLLRNVLKTLGGAGPLFRGDVCKGGRHGEALDYSTVWYHFERYVEQALCWLLETSVRRKRRILRTDVSSSQHTLIWNVDCKEKYWCNPSNPSRREVAFTVRACLAMG